VDLKDLDMNDRLDDLIGRLSTSPTDRSLDGFEAQVGCGIAARRRDARAARAMAPVRFASLGLALAMGVTVGGAAATTAVMTPKAFNTFSSAAHLAPSTILESSR
jgi:hypothetical protein